MRSTKHSLFWILCIPVIFFFYLGLFITIIFWYPSGLTAEQWRTHLMHFSILYIFWTCACIAYQLFDIEILRSISKLILRLFTTFAVLLIVAIVYFYVQPELLLTPRRFLLAHTFISGAGILLWYIFMYKVNPYISRSMVFAFEPSYNDSSLEELVQRYSYVGLTYGGSHQNIPINPSRNSVILVVVPPVHQLAEDAKRDLFLLRKRGVNFLAYQDLHERLTRTVHLPSLTEAWFINFISYSSHRVFDTIKRIIDIIFGSVGMIILAAFTPLIFIGVKLTSRGALFFSQQRVGLSGRSFLLYKFRTMDSAAVNDIWTKPGDTRITTFGKFLRATRLDELPQSWNILKGDMSIVGPRPEQVHIVEQLRQDIPYYDERHIVKPGLTGWAQLHVYAASIEETKRKLQYDLYYIKHRSLLFDTEIILKTIYNIITLSGR